MSPDRGGQAAAAVAIGADRAERPHTGGVHAQAPPSGGSLDHRGFAIGAGDRDHDRRLGAMEGGGHLGQPTSWVAILDQ